MGEDLHDRIPRELAEIEHVFHPDLLADAACNHLTVHRENLEDTCADRTVTHYRCTYHFLTLSFLISGSPWRPPLLPSPFRPVPPT